MRETIREQFKRAAARDALGHKFRQISNQWAARVITAVQMWETIVELRDAARV